MWVVGVDVGLDGGVVIRDPHLGFFLRTPMPTLPTGKGNQRVYDEAEIVRIFRGIPSGDLVHVFVEDVHAMPKQGVSSTFVFGTGFGALRMLPLALGYARTLVSPRIWQKVLFEGMAKGDSKEMSVLRASTLWPTETWVFGRDRKPHDGVTDAALISEWGIRTLRLR